jgi:uncharacterized protein
MGSPTLQALLAQRFDRRRLLGGGVELAAATLVASADTTAWAASGLTFAGVAASKADAVIVPAGYRADVVIRWGDPLFAASTSLDSLAVAEGALLAPEAADAQAGQFGYNCDGIGLFALDERRYLLCVNHEFPMPALLFPGWVEAREARRLGPFVRERPAVVAYMQAAVGLSVVEVERGARWSYRPGRRYNRRVTANTPIEISGPARNHVLLNPRGVPTPQVFGTFGNCAAGVTPWNTAQSASIGVSVSGSATAPIGGSTRTHASIRPSILPRASSSAGSSSSTRSLRIGRRKSVPH